MDDTGKGWGNRLQSTPARTGSGMPIRIEERDIEVARELAVLG